MLSRLEGRSYQMNLQLIWNALRLESRQLKNLKRYQALPEMQALTIRCLAYFMMLDTRECMAAWVVIR